MPWISPFFAENFQIPLTSPITHENNPEKHHRFNNIPLCCHGLSSFSSAYLNHFASSEFNSSSCSQQLDILRIFSSFRCELQHRRTLMPFLLSLGRYMSLQSSWVGARRGWRRHFPNLPRTANCHVIVVVVLGMLSSVCHYHFVLGVKRWALSTLGGFCVPTKHLRA